MTEIGVLRNGSKGKQGGHIQDGQWQTIPTSPDLLAPGLIGHSQLHNGFGTGSGSFSIPYDVGTMNATQMAAAKNTKVFMVEFFLLFLFLNNLIVRSTQITDQFQRNLSIFYTNVPLKSIFVLKVFLLLDVYKKMSKSKYLFRRIIAQTDTNHVM